MRVGLFRFVAVEGANGVGKSTVAAHLRDQLNAALFHFPPEFLAFREDVRLDAEVPAVPRLAYYVAATLHQSAQVDVELERRHVVCDRYLASPVALIVAEGALEEAEADRIVNPARPYLRSPDLTIFMTADHAVASERIRARDRPSDKLKPVHRRAVRSPEFFEHWQSALRRQVARLGPVVEIDSTELGIQDMVTRALAAVSDVVPAHS